MELLKDQLEQEKLRPLKIWPRLSLNRFVLLENVELTFSDRAFLSKLNESNASKDLPFYVWLSFSWWFLGVADTNDVIQKIEKTLNNTHTTTQKLTNNSVRNTKKHPFSYMKVC